MPVPPGLKLTPTLLAQSLKLTQLRKLACSLGTPISGTKRALAEAMCGVLGRSRFPIASIRGRDGGGSGSGAVRILSVDMGIRNLAACLLEVPGGWKGLGIKRGKDRHTMMVPSVIAWQRMSILPTTTTNIESKPGETPPPQPPTPPTPQTVESFSASTFSHHAHSLALTLLHLSPPLPHQILIETQRYRSHGGAAVQEWTLRVNMLESMLWGCLRTLAELGVWGVKDGRVVTGEGKEVVEQGGEVIEGINPGKVVGFWEGLLAEYGVAKVEKLQTTYAESKKSKTRVVKSLLCPPYMRTQSSPPSCGGTGMPLFELGTEQARETAGLFLEMGGDGGKVGAKVKKPLVVGKRSKKQPKGKLDDLADCLLQGLAWVKWEEGRRRVISGKGVLAGVDIAGLVERGRMLEEGVTGGRERVVQKAVKKVKRGRKKVTQEAVKEAKRGRKKVVQEAVKVKRGRKKVAQEEVVVVKQKPRVKVKKVGIQETKETTPQGIETLTGKVEAEVKLESTVGAKMEDTLSALIPIVEPAKPRKPRARKLPPPGSISMPALGTETKAGEGKVTTQECVGTLRQEIEPVSGIEAELGLDMRVLAKDPHTVPPPPVQIVEPVLLPIKTRKPRARKLPPTEAGAYKENELVQENKETTSHQITTRQSETVSGKGEAEPESGAEMEGANTAPATLIENVEPAKKARKPRTRKLPQPEVVYLSLEAKGEQTVPQGIEAEDTPAPAPPVQILEAARKPRKPRTKKQARPEFTSILIPSVESGAGGEVAAVIAQA